MHAFYKQNPKHWLGRCHCLLGLLLCPVCRQTETMGWKWMAFEPKWLLGVIVWASAKICHHSLASINQTCTLHCMVVLEMLESAKRIFSQVECASHSAFVRVRHKGVQICCHTLVSKNWKCTMHCMVFSEMLEKANRMCSWVECHSQSTFVRVGS